MRAFSLETELDLDRILNAIKSELESHARENGGLENAILTLEVRSCRDEKKITEPRLNARRDSVNVMDYFT